MLILKTKIMQTMKGIATVNLRILFTSPLLLILKRFMTGCLHKLKIKLIFMTGLYDLYELITL